MPSSPTTSEQLLVRQGRQQPNGEKADFIEGLDATDEIKIIGVFTPDISVIDNVTARGVTGIGIYAKEPWKGLHRREPEHQSDSNMTTGDGSTTAMNNQMWSYWETTLFPLCRPKKERGYERLPALAD